jgi:uncharacterized membrane-anchored protein YhcB (DUF1043 family)
MLSQPETSSMNMMWNGIAILALGGGGGAFLINLLRSDLKELGTDLKKLKEKIGAVEKNVEGYFRNAVSTQKKVAKKLRKALEDDDE